VKITIMFRGREVFHPELGRRILDRIAEQMDGSAKVESEARLDGRNMVMVLAPDKRARQAQAAKGDGAPEASTTNPPSRTTSPSPTTPPLPTTPQSAPTAAPPVAVPASAPVASGSAPSAASPTPASVVSDSSVQASANVAEPREG
jgi:translation initiation factor IF-3